MGEIESLMNNIHPTVATMVRTSLLNTLTNMIVKRAVEVAELDQIERELAGGDFGSW